MKLLDMAERRFGRYAIKNLTFWLMIGQVFVFAVFFLLRWPILGHIVLLPDLVKEGQVWRIVSFLFVPPPASPIFMAFALYMFYIYGSALEEVWGEFRYNLFILSATVLTVACAFAVPGQVTTNVFIGMSVFLAFATLFPNYQIMLFFVLPVKVKWLGILTWAVFLFTLYSGPDADRFMVIAATANFLLFFGRSMIRGRKAIQRRKAYEAQAREIADEPFHRCCICGATEKTHPDALFVYKDGRGYCDEHKALMDKPEAEQLEAAGGSFKG